VYWIYLSHNKILDYQTTFSQEQETYEDFFFEAFELNLLMKARQVLSCRKLLVSIQMGNATYPEKNNHKDIRTVQTIILFFNFFFLSFFQPTILRIMI